MRGPVLPADVVGGVWVIWGLGFSGALLGWDRGHKRFLGARMLFGGSRDGIDGEALISLTRTQNDANITADRCEWSVCLRRSGKSLARTNIRDETTLPTAKLSRRDSAAIRPLLKPRVLS